MSKLINRKVAAIALGIMSLASAAQAGSSVVYTYNSETYGGLYLGIQTSDFNGDALVGEFNMTSTTPGFTTPLNTYCTDVGVLLQTTYTYTPTPLSSATGVSPAWITGGIQNAANAWYDNHNSTANAIQCAGLQLAIWELLYNNAVSVSYTTFFSGTNNGFHLTTDDPNTIAAATYAAAVINSLSGQPDNSSKVTWLAPLAANGSIGGSQGLLMITPGQSSIPGSPVPDASSTLALLGTAAAGVLAAKRKLPAAAN